MTFQDRQRWVTRGLVLLVVFLALMWGLAAETAYFQEKKLQKLEKTVERSNGGQSEQIQVQ